MRIGLSVPQTGQLGERDTITAVAGAAEAAGYDSLWAMDRLLAPVAPRSPYPGTPDGSLPAEHHRVLDPLGVLGLAAAVTERVRLGTNVLVAPWYPPVLLARSLTTLDRLSDGRLTVGLGMGWSVDEYEAVSVPKRDTGARLEEALDVLEAVWRPGVVRHDGRFTSIVPCTVEPKPVQRPHPPLLLAAFTPAGLDRVARRADGWLPVGLPHEVLATMWGQLRDLAHGHGRDPDRLQLVVRANVEVSESPLGPDRAVFTGSVDQLVEDVEATRRAGATELVLDLHADARSADDVLGLSEAITAGHRTSATAGRPPRSARPPRRSPSPAGAVR